MSALCPHFGTCGGCTFLDIPYARELAKKEASLGETLGDYAPLLGEVLPSPVMEGYRNKMELAFGDNGPERLLALGIRKKRSFYEVATTEQCVLMHDDFKKIAAFAMDFFRKSGDTFFHRKRHTGSLRHLVLRRGFFTGEVLVMLSAASTLAVHLADFPAGLLALPLEGNIVGVLHAVNDGVADAVKNENVTTLWGRDYYREKLCGLTFHVSQFSFFQTNTAGAQVLYDAAKKQLMPGKMAYDLYCGTGTIAQLIAPMYNKVVGIELNPDAIAAAKENAALNGISNCVFHTADITKQAAQENNLLSGETPDLIIVDPPRDGLAPKVIPAITALAPQCIIYIACKPASLARDIPLLVAQGYRPEAITGVDLFPRTPHV